jgi:branched-subunit amino acid transport protein AzlD
VPLNENDPDVMSYLRRYKDQAVLVVLNMSSQARTIDLDLSPKGFTSMTAQTVLTTMSKGEKERSLSQIPLEPFSVYIGELSK